MNEGMRMHFALYGTIENQLTSIEITEQKLGIHLSIPGLRLGATAT